MIWAKHKSNSQGTPGSVTTSWLPRTRWNVVDLITVVNREIIPSYYFLDIDMTAAEQWRCRLKEQGEHISITAILLKAIATAQMPHPNSRTFLLPNGKRVLFPHITAGFTVEKSVGGKPCVFFGVINDAQRKSVLRITSELNDYADKDIHQLPQLSVEHYFSKVPWIIRQVMLWLCKRTPSLRRKYLGATFGLSSLGKLGVRAVIGPCVCTCTFGVGALEDRPVVVNGAIAVRPMLTLTLGADSRVMDLADAQAFLAEIKRLVERDMEDLIAGDDCIEDNPCADQRKKGTPLQSLG
jgi:pyruvate/2-oxoglutarate dehydrogenase complex dihydrolipoamide acyltransferase (E2) component